MDAVLHVEPITRSTPIPLSIGHTEYLKYGERMSDDETPVHMFGGIQLGCPLETPELGQTRQREYIPLVKTIGYAPDNSRDRGFVYSETLHYLKDRKFLIPFRSKIRSEIGQFQRISHLPSLNLVRKEITGFRQPVIDPRPQLLTDLLLCDQTFGTKANQSLRDWIIDDVLSYVSSSTTVPLTFEENDVNQICDNYTKLIRQAPLEMNLQYARNFLQTMSSETAPIPPRFLSHEPLRVSLQDVRSQIVTQPIDFRSLGHIPIERLPSIEYNPFAFRDVCEMIDAMPLTDFNVDVVLGVDEEIQFFHPHFVLDRFGEFSNYDPGIYDPVDIVEDYLDAARINDILVKFICYHQGITEEIQELLQTQPVKMKIIKTITEEAAILIYPYNSDGQTLPLCGVYFDMALLSLAPMSIMGELTPN